MATIDSMWSAWTMTWCKTVEGGGKGRPRLVNWIIDAEMLPEAFTYERLMRYGRSLASLVKMLFIRMLPC